MNTPERTAEKSVIVDVSGKPARANTCPNCGKPKEFRKPQSTFGGEDKFHCVNCGSDW